MPGKRTRELAVLPATLAPPFGRGSRAKARTERVKTRRPFSNTGNSPLSTFHCVIALRRCDFAFGKITGRMISAPTVSTVPGVGAAICRPRGVSRIARKGDYTGVRRWTGGCGRFVNRPYVIHRTWRRGDLRSPARRKPHRPRGDHIWRGDGRRFSDPAGAVSLQANRYAGI